MKSDNERATRVLDMLRNFSEVAKRTTLTVSETRKAVCRMVHLLNLSGTFVAGIESWRCVRCGAAISTADIAGT